MIIDGRSIAARMLEAARQEAERLPRPPSFAAIAVAPSPATESYLRIKERQAARAGVRMEVVAPAEATTESLIELIERDAHDALIVQLPLPDGIDTKAVLAAIPPGKDADVLSPKTRAERTLTHPVAGAVKTILDEAGLAPAGRTALVIGKGWLVGEPVSAWLTHAGAHVITVTREEGDFTEAARAADIIVAGAGAPGILAAEQVKPGAAVIDVGTSELGGSLAGDASPEVAAVAGIFTPVPGGVGPVAVACLMENVVALASRALQEGRESV